MKKLPYFSSIGYHVLGYVFRLSRERLLICGNMASRVHSPQNKIAPYTTATASSHLIWLQWHISQLQVTAYQGIAKRHAYPAFHSLTPENSAAP